MNYLITGKNYTSELFNLLDENNVKIIKEKQLLESDILFENEDKIYVASESALEIVLNRFKNSNKKEVTKILKDKIKFRKILHRFHPNFYFEEVFLDSFDKIKLPEDRKFIIKPSKGFFGTAVRTIDSDTNLKELKNELAAEIQLNTEFFSEAVLSKNTFIIEEFAEGKEYAVDMFYNKNSEPVIMNIYHHPFHQNEKYFHSIYYTGEEIYKKIKPKIQKILKEYNSVLNISCYPIHCEFKIENDKIIPIEFNPLRFGGFGLGDLTFHAFNFNPFEYFFEDISPEWDEIWEKSQNKYFAWVLGYNGENLNTDKYYPDHDKFKKFIDGHIKYIEINHKENPAFSIAYLATDDYSKIEDFLSIEYKDFFFENK